jgi:hypothetical protein
MNLHVPGHISLNSIICNSVQLQQGPNPDHFVLPASKDDQIRKVMAVKQKQKKKEKRRR